jgi:hypothetical protein
MCLGGSGCNHPELRSRDRHGGGPKEAAAWLIDFLGLRFPGRDMFAHSSPQRRAHTITADPVPDPR